TLFRSHRLVHEIPLCLYAYLLCTLSYVELTDDPVRKLFSFAAHSFSLIASLELYRKKDNISSLSGTLSKTNYIDVLSTLKKDTLDDEHTFSFITRTTVIYSLTRARDLLLLAILPYLHDFLMCVP